MTPDRKSISVGDLVRALERGEVVGLPTDTVYGLAARLSQPTAVDLLFHLKGRPRDLAIPVLVADLAQAEDVAGGADPRLTVLADHFWPGALTVALRRGRDTEPDLGGDPATVGVRSPDDDVIRALCRRVGPLAVTSANRHGDPPARTAVELRSTFDADVGTVLDGGVRDGQPSTVVSIVEATPRCVREGAIPFAEVIAALDGRPRR
ncbi:MAG TPA: L-threonylcarbamoyladenylate synthase [Acidimicrobiales bacterium]|nr:L-threonylcarbamoyladenylate synthase [Acidimicrobiales bacterium]